LFDNIDTVIAAQLERAIEETVLNFEPRVQISNITAIPKPDENRYSIQLDFFVINNVNPITINFFLERIR
jgi:predicted component of type VI protein secretion system